jgi:hypothetical protein
MSICYHPELFDAERFEQERGVLRGQKLGELVSTCTNDEHSFGWGMDESDLDSDIISQRGDRDRNVVGSLVDNVILGLKELGRPEVAPWLRRVTEADGSLVRDCFSYLGYLPLTEVERSIEALQTLTFGDEWQERDRRLLLKVFAVAVEHRSGLTWMIL